MLILLFLVLTSVGCSKGTGSGSAKSDKFDPCEALRRINPHCDWKPHWDDAGVSTNAIDGTKTEFLTLESSDSDGMDYGRIHYAELRLCFENGGVCGNGIVGVGVTLKGMVSSDRNNSTPVRLKFDNEEPARESWGISSDHDTLYPYGHEAQFLSQLILHKKLILEFSYYEKTPRTITFELSGLLDKMQAQGLQDPTPELEARRKAKSEADAKFAIQQAVQQKHLAAQQAVEQKNLKQERDAEEKRLSGLRAECAPYVNGPSPDMVHGKTYHLPPKECREILSWTHDGYIDVLYELQDQARIKHP
jgi:hypothetical protein